MKKKESTIPCVWYLYLHFKIWEYFKSEDVSIKDVKKYLFQWRVPKKIRHLVIKELEVLGLVKIMGRKVLISRPTFNIDNCNKYYQYLQVF